MLFGLLVIAFITFVLISPGVRNPLPQWSGGTVSAIQKLIAPPPLPGEVMNDFCGAIYSKHYLHAYDYYSQQLQRNVSLQKFTDLWSAHGRRFYSVSCEVGTPQTQGNQTQITVTFSEFYKGWRVTSRVNMIQEHDDEWKISSIEPFPAEPANVGMTLG